MHVHISRHRNHGYVPADDCLCFALIYLCMVCMWLLCECDVSFWFSFGNSPVYLKKAQMTSSYFSNDLSLRYSCIYFSPVTPLYTWENSRNKFGFGFWPFLMVLVYKWVLFLLIMVCMWLLCECDVCFLFFFWELSCILEEGSHDKFLFLLWPFLEVQLGLSFSSGKSSVYLGKTLRTSSDLAFDLSWWYLYTNEFRFIW